MHLVTLDWILIATFLAASLLVPVWLARRAGRSTEDFFVSGRKLSWWLAGTSMVATTFAADTPLAVTELVRRDGVAGNWLWWSMLASGMLTVFLYARLWRRTGVMTDVELSELRYGGRRAAGLRAFRATYLALPVNAVVIGWVTTAMSSVLQVTFDLPAGSRAAVVLGLLGATAVYSMLGGLQGVVITDAFQFVLAMGGCTVLAVLAVRSPEVGGLSGLVRQLAHSHPQALSMMPATQGAVWVFIVYITVQWWASWYPGAEPGGGGYVAQRMMACRDERHAMGATLWFNVAHYALRPWPWILVALVSLVVLPGEVDHKAAYTRMMLRYLPPGGRGLMLVAFLAAYMSTISTQLNWGSGYLVHDLYRRFARRDATEQHYVRMSRLATLLTAAAGAGATLLMQEVRGGWELLLAIGAGTGPVYLLRWYWWRINAWSEISAMAVSLVLALGQRALVARGVHLPGQPYDVVLVAVPTTLAWLAVTFMTKPEPDAVLRTFFEKARPGGAGWARFAHERPDLAIDRHLGRNILHAVCGMALVYGVLLGTGGLLLQRPGVDLAGLAVAVAAGIGLVLEARAGHLNLRR